MLRNLILVLGSLAALRRKVEPVIEAFRGAATRGALLGVALSESTPSDYIFNGIRLNQSDSIESAASLTPPVAKRSSCSTSVPTQDTESVIENLIVD